MYKNLRAILRTASILYRPISASQPASKPTSQPASKRPGSKSPSLQTCGLELAIFL